MKAVQYKPIIVAMDLIQMSLEDINKVLSAIISLQLRNIFIGNESSNTLEQFYPNIAKSIYEQTLNDSDTIVHTIHAKMISDTVLKERFLTKNTNK